MSLKPQRFGSRFYFYFQLSYLDLVQISGKVDQRAEHIRLFSSFYLKMEAKPTSETLLFKNTEATVSHTVVSLPPVVRQPLFSGTQVTVGKIEG
jgi:hypothetical protein